MTFVIDDIDKVLFANSWRSVRTGRGSFRASA